MRKIKTCVIAVLLLLLLLAPSLIQPAKASSNNIWEAAWLDYQSDVDPEGVHQPVANLSTSTMLTDDTGMFTTKIALVVPVYQYQSYDIWDCVNFRTCLYFDSFAEGNLVPAFTSQVIFVIEKDTGGSDLNKQKIEWWRSDVDSYSQGEGLSQYSPMGSTEEDRSFWALEALAFGAGLFLEPVSVATDLIGVAQAFLGGGLVDDCIDAGYEDIEADSYWGSGIGDHPSPSRQYCFNIARWIQKATNPSSFYGLKIWAKVSLDPLYNPYDVLDVWMGPIYLRIHHSHALSISATSGGNTEPYPGTYHYKEGTSVTVKANAYSGWAFNYWVLDGATVYDNPITVTMNSDHTLKAYFQYSGGGGGGECPYVSVWDGSNYVLDNSILPTSQLGNGADVEDYYRLEQTLVRQDGKYSLLISEFEKEHSYIDQVKLLAVDHESDVNIAVAPDGEFLTYKDPVAPLYAVDVNGTDRLDQIRYMDGNLSDPTTFFQGTEDDYLLLNFGQVNSENAKLIVRNDMYCMIKCINVQVMDSNGEWQTVAVIASRTYWAVEGVNLSPYVVEGRDLLVRLGWTMPHKLDYVGLDTTKQDDCELCEANLVSATHSTQGDVKALLIEGDNTHAELIPGQQIQLEFTLPNNSKQARTYILYTKGHWYTIQT